MKPADSISSPKDHSLPNEGSLSGSQDCGTDVIELTKGNDEEKGAVEEKGSQNDRRRKRRMCICISGFGCLLFLGLVALAVAPPLCIFKGGCAPFKASPAAAAAPTGRSTYNKVRPEHKELHHQP